MKYLYLYNFFLSQKPPIIYVSPDFLKFVKIFIFSITQICMESVSRFFVIVQICVADKKIINTLSVQICILTPKAMGCLRLVYHGGMIPPAPPPKISAPVAPMDMKL